MGLLEDAIQSGDEDQQAELSTFFKEAQATHRALNGDLPGTTRDPRAPAGFTVPNGGRNLPPETAAALDQIYKIEGRAAVDKQMREQEFQRQLQTANIIKQIQGVDPQLQAHILSRMGLDNISSNVPAIASKEQQQAASRLAEIKYKHDLEAPEREAKRLDDVRLRNAQLNETITNNRAMAQYREELALMRAEAQADKKIDRLKTIAGILQGGEFMAGVDPTVRAGAQRKLYEEAIQALNEKHPEPVRPTFRDPGNTHPLAEQGFNPGLVSPGSTSGGASRQSGPDLTRGVDMGNGVTVRQITPGNAPVAVQDPRGVSIVPPNPNSGVVPGDRSGFNWQTDPAELERQRAIAYSKGNQLYKNEHGQWIQPGYENSPTKTKVPLTPSRRSDNSLYRRHRDRAYEP